jgi:hypothetical protein
MLVGICCWEENEAILCYSRASDVRDVVQGCMAFSFWFSALGMPWIVGKTMIACTFVGLGRLLGTCQVHLGVAGDD